MGLWDDHDEKSFWNSHVAAKDKKAVVVGGNSSVMMIANSSNGRASKERKGRRTEHDDDDDDKVSIDRPVLNHETMKIVRQNCELRMMDDFLGHRITLRRFLVWTCIAFGQKQVFNGRTVSLRRFW